jgi:hypothetical protein
MVDLRSAAATTRSSEPREEPECLSLRAGEPGCADEEFFHCAACDGSVTVVATVLVFWDWSATLNRLGLLMPWASCVVAVAMA